MKRTHLPERGNSILEFALVGSLFLVPMLAGSYSLGMSLVKSLQVGQVVRDANILAVRGVNLSQSNNQSIVVRTASGLGMNVSGTNTADANGLGVLVLSTVHRVSGSDCAGLGYTSSGTLSDGSPNYPTCPNFMYYVFRTRIVIGNVSKLPNSSSALGTPSDTLASDGTLTPAQYVVNTGDRATGFPSNSAVLPTDANALNGLVFLTAGNDAYVCEGAFDISAMNVFTVPRMGTIYARHVS